MLFDKSSDRFGNLHAGRRFNALQTGRRIDFDDPPRPPSFRDEQVDPRKVQSVRLGRSNGQFPDRVVHFERARCASPVQVGPKVAGRGASLHRGDGLPADNNDAHVPIAGLCDVFLDQRHLLKVVQDSVGVPRGRQSSYQYHATSLRPPANLEHHRQTADQLYGLEKALRLADYRRARHGDVIVVQKLHAQQLVPRTQNAERRIERPDVLLLELAHDGAAEFGNRGPDSRNDCIRHPIGLWGCVTIQYDVLLKGILYSKLMPTFLERLDQAAGAIECSLSGENGDLHHHKL